MDLCTLKEWEWAEQTDFGDKQTSACNYFKHGVQVCRRRGVEITIRAGPESQLCTFITSEDKALHFVHHW